MVGARASASDQREPRCSPPNALLEQVVRIVTNGAAGHSRRCRWQRRLPVRRRYIPRHIQESWLSRPWTIATASSPKPVAANMSISPHQARTCRLPRSSTLTSWFAALPSLHLSWPACLRDGSSRIDKQSADAAISQLVSQALDLGSRGPDKIYGNGLVGLKHCVRPSRWQNAGLEQRRGIGGLPLGRPELRNE